MSRVLGDVLVIVVLGAGLDLAGWCWLFTGADWNGGDPEAVARGTTPIAESRGTLP